MNTTAVHERQRALLATKRQQSADLEARASALGQTERRLRAAWRRLRKAEQVSRLGSWEMELVTGKSIWSDEFYRICGMIPGQVPATAEEGFKLIHPDDRERAAAEVTRAIENGSNYHIEKRIVRPSGEVRYVESIGQIVTDASGCPERLMGSLMDITERKLAEEQLHHTLADLKERNEELDAFASTVAHDLRTPLGLISGFAQVMADALGDDQPEEVMTALEVMTRTSDKMVAIVDSLLLLASVRHLDEINVRPVETGQVVANSLARLAHLIVESEAEISLPDCWPAAVGYGPWIEEVWANYVSNAIKYGGRPPRIELGSDLHGEMVRFWVRDNGQGLSSDQQAQLFTRFSRLPCQRVDGHGLGLSIVRSIVEKLGGEVGVESDEGRGSLFYFTLPCVAKCSDPLSHPGA